MEDERLPEASSEQLERVQAFFPRLDSKTTGILGINIAMVGVLAVNAPPFHQWSWLMLIAIVPLSFIAVSLFHVYNCSFPHLEGGHDSLIYFREIAKMTETQYIEQFCERPLAGHINDILGQVWRNSEILRLKFHAIRLAHMWLVSALIPWIATLFVFAAINNGKESFFH